MHNTCFHLASVSKGAKDNKSTLEAWFWHGVSIWEHLAYRFEKMYQMVFNDMYYIICIVYIYHSIPLMGMYLLDPWRNSPPVGPRNCRWSANEIVDVRGLEVVDISRWIKKKRSGHPGWDLGEKAKMMEFDLVFSFKCFQCILCLCFAYKSHCFMRHWCDLTCILLVGTFPEVDDSNIVEFIGHPPQILQPFSS